MSYQFEGKIAIVTGSARGIGRTIARELCKKGVRVVINDINAERLEVVEKEFRAEGYDVTSCLADVTRFEDCEKLVQTAIGKYGGLDILVNNAGISQAAFFEDMTHHTFKKVLDLCAYGAAFPTKAALPELIRQKGSVIFISSAGSFYGTAASTAYTMGKMGLTGFAQSMRLELAHTGIHIGLIYPSLTKNDPDKTSISATGELIKVPYRPPGLQISQESVANAVLLAVAKRKKKVVVSFGAKVYVFMAVYLPGILFMILSASQRKMKNLYNK